MAEILPPLLRKQAGLLAAIALILSLTFISLLTAPANAAKSLVTVYADNSERIISTTVETVGEALQRAEIELGEHDLVEPAVDTVINEAVFKVNVYRARPVTVVDGATQKTVSSPYKSPRLIAESAGYQVFDEDKFTFELIDNILETGSIGQRLTIDRATPVNISLYGDVFVHRTHAATVGIVFSELGINLTADDESVLPLDSRIVADLDIGVVRVGTAVVVEDEPIPFAVEIIQDSNREVGDDEVKASGQDGISSVTYEVGLENGEEISRIELQRVTKQEPVTEVRVVGTLRPTLPTVNVSGTKQDWLLASGISSEHWAYVDAIVSHESGWNPNAINPSSGACGLGQQLPCGKWAGAWNDPVAALRAMDVYVQGYGGWAAAETFRACVGECYSARAGATVFKSATWY